jgi:antitoxin YefM
VLISLEDFASYEETAHLLKSPRNAERLQAAIEALDAGEGTERKLAE